jgi:hypothetical protein
MTTRARCPNCGGLVTADAAWCGQCLTPLGGAAAGGAAPTGSRPEAPEAAGQSGPPGGPSPTQPPRDIATDGRPPLGGPPRPIRAGKEGVVWECPTCGTENAIEATTCRGCGTPFSRLFEEERARPSVEPGRAVALSLLFPGLGHAAAGRRAEGVARAFVFAYTLITVVTILVSRAGEGLGPFLPLVLISALAGVTLYVLTALDAGRLARGEPPILSTRALLYGAVALMLLTVVVLVVLGARSVGPGG